MLAVKRVTAEEAIEELKKHTNHPELIDWVKRKVTLCEPDNFRVCDGSQEEYDMLCNQMVEAGIFTKLKPRENSFLARSTEDDVARLETRTIVCSNKKEDAGPTNNWEDPAKMRHRLHNLLKGCMHGRTMYVIPFSMGPLKSKISKIGIQISDSPYVVVNMRIMTRMGQGVLNELGPNDTYVHCLHSVGMPLQVGQKDSLWPSNPDKWITHFPDQRYIISYGSGYGGNALLGKKAFALRIASVMAKEQGWLAEHMLILRITNPEGKKKFIAAAFPSAGGKTNLAMMQPSLSGWSIKTVGDDIAWMKFGDDGRLYAINPEAGCFGVAPGTSDQSNPNAMKMISKNSVFTNVALTKDGDVWWEGLTKETPEGLINWKGKPHVIGGSDKAAHPNARFTAPLAQCPIVDPEYDNPQGVPIDAILFGGRRSKTIPLVSEALTWNHGVYMGASMSSEVTSAALDVKDPIRHDPFAMLPFCGYNMADYFAHWLEMNSKLAKDSSKLPKIFFVNWFRKDSAGKFIWPGFGDNSRVLKWIFERTENADNFETTPVGLLPKEGTIDMSGIEGKVSKEALHDLLTVNKKEWMDEVANVRDYFQKTFGSTLPKELEAELSNLEQRLKQ